MEKKCFAIVIGPRLAQHPKAVSQSSPRVVVSSHRRIVLSRRRVVLSSVSSRLVNYIISVGVSSRRRIVTFASSCPDFSHSRLRRAA